MSLELRKDGKPWCYGKMDIDMELPCATCKYQKDCWAETFGEYLTSEWRPPTR